MAENRGPLGFPRLTDRGPLVKKEYSLDKRFGSIPGGGGFGSRMEYEVGAQRIGEACHCILGSLGKVKRRDDIFKDMGVRYESGHIYEELGIIKKSVSEYSHDVYTNQLLDSDYYGKYIPMMMKETPKASINIQTLAKEKKDNLDPSNELCVNIIANDVYDVLIELGRSMEHSLKRGIPSKYKNAFKDKVLRESIKKLEKDIDECMKVEA